MSREEELEKKLKEVILERNQYHAQLTDLMLKHLRADVDDHETRLRIVEPITTKNRDETADHKKRLEAIEPIVNRSNVLFGLATGGGLLSIFVLIREVAGLIP